MKNIGTFIISSLVFFQTIRKRIIHDNQRRETVQKYTQKSIKNYNKKVKN